MSAGSVNNVLLANIASVDGIAKSNIASIAGVPIPAAANLDFVIEVDTTQAGSASDTIVLALTSGGTFDGTIDWGDASTSDLTYANREHTYASGGTYTITISGDTFEGWQVAYSGDRMKFIDIQNWGFFTISNHRTFDHCENLDVTATDAPTITTTSFYCIFRNCDALTTPDFSNWDTSTVTSMQDAFWKCDLFNGNVDGWVHSNVTVLRRMFIMATSFNQDLSSWDVSGVTNWYEFLRGANAFDSSMEGWIVQGSFNELVFGIMANFTGIGLDSWDTSGMTSFRKAFESTPSFNPDISGWDVSGVTNMQKTFQNCDVFDQDLSSWDINQVSDFSNFMGGTTQLSTANYDALLIAWDAQGVMSYSGTVNFGGSKYTSGGAAETARTSLITKWGGITDGGVA